MKQEYTVLQYEYLSDLIEEVEERLNEDWVCVGGVAISPDQYFYQAMVKSDFSIVDLKQLPVWTTSYVNTND